MSFPRAGQDLEELLYVVVAFGMGLGRASATPASFLNDGIHLRDVQGEAKDRKPWAGRSPCGDIQSLVFTLLTCFELLWTKAGCVSISCVLSHLSLPPSLPLALG